MILNLTFDSQSEDRIHEDDSQIQLNITEEQEVGGKSYLIN